MVPLGLLIVHDYCKYSIESALNRPVLNRLFPVVWFCQWATISLVWHCVWRWSMRVWTKYMSRKKRIQENRIFFLSFVFLHFWTLSTGTKTFLFTCLFKIMSLPFRFLLWPQLEAKMWRRWPGTSWAGWWGFPSDQLEGCQQQKALQQDGNKDLAFQ